MKRWPFEIAFWVLFVVLLGVRWGADWTSQEATPIFIGLLICWAVKTSIREQSGKP